MSKLFQSLGLKDKKQTITTTVGDLSTKTIKSGYFSKRGPKRNSKYNLRYWILSETHLYYFPSAAAQDQALGAIDVKSCKVNTDGIGSYEFVILNATSEKTREYFCKSDSPDSKSSWVTAINGCITKLNTGRQTYAGAAGSNPGSPAPVNRLTGPESSMNTNQTSPRISQIQQQQPGSPSSSGGGSNSPNMDSPNLSAMPRSPFPAAGPVVPFIAEGKSEILRFFLADNSSKTLMFDTRNSVQDLCQQLAKKLGQSMENMCLYSICNAVSTVLEMESSLISVIGAWPTKNDAKNYRLVFQPREETERQRASTVGFLNIQTSENTHSGGASKNTSFVSQMIGVIKNKPEWVGNVLLANLKGPHQRKGILMKKGSKNKEVLAIVDENNLYYFHVEATNTDKSKGWVPLSNAALYKDRGPLGFTLFYIFPGTLDIQKYFDVVCKSEADKDQWIQFLAPICKGALPQKTLKRGPSGSPTASPHRKAASTATATSKTADIGQMLKSTPPDSPKLAHPTAGRPKGAGRLPTTARPKGPGPSGLVSSTSPLVSSASSPSLFSSNNYTASTTPSAGFGSNNVASSPQPIPNASHSPYLGSNSSTNIYSTSSNLHSNSSSLSDPPITDSPRALGESPRLSVFMPGESPRRLSNVGAFFSTSQGSLPSPRNNVTTQGNTSQSPRGMLVPAATAPSPLSLGRSPPLPSSASGPVFGSPSNFGTPPTTQYNSMTTPLNNNIGYVSTNGTLPNPASANLKTNTSLSNSSPAVSRPLVTPPPSASPKSGGYQPVNGYQPMNGLTVSSPQIGTNSNHGGIINLMHSNVYSTPSFTSPMLPSPSSPSPLTGPSLSSSGAYTSRGMTHSTSNPAIPDASTSPKTFNSSPSSNGPVFDEVLDIRALMNAGNPALGSNNFKPYQGTPPTSSSLLPTNPKAGMVYSPVLAKPMPVPSTNPSLSPAAAKKAPMNYNLPTTTTIPQQPSYTQSNNYNLPTNLTTGYNLPTNVTAGYTPSPTLSNNFTIATNSPAPFSNNNRPPSGLLPPTDLSSSPGRATIIAPTPLLSQNG